MGYAFISYSSKDLIPGNESKTYADAMRELFNQNGIPTWMAPYDIPLGDTYPNHIVHAIRDCACIVLLLTDNSQNSMYVQRELERALFLQKPIVPVVLQKDLTPNAYVDFIIGPSQRTMYVSSVDITNDEIRKLVANVTALVRSAKQEPEPTGEPPRKSGEVPGSASASESASTPAPEPAPATASTPVSSDRTVPSSQFGRKVLGFLIAVICVLVIAFLILTLLEKLPTQKNQANTAQPTLITKTPAVNTTPPAVNTTLSAVITAPPAVNTTLSAVITAPPVETSETQADDQQSQEEQLSLTDLSADYLALGDKYLQDEEYEKAEEAYWRGAELGNKKCCARIRDMFSDEKYGMVDYEKVVKAYWREGELGDKYAWYKIGDMYSDAKYGMVDYNKALEAYKKGANLSEPETICLSRIGDMYRDGKLGQVDYVKALEFYQQAVDSGDSFCWSSIGDIYLYKFEMQDYSKAMEAYLRGVEEGNSFCYFRIGHMYSDEKYGILNYTKALEAYQSGAKLKSSVCYHRLGDMYREEQYGMVDYAKAVEAYQCGADLGWDHSNYMLGIMYSDAAYGMVDLEQAVYYLQLAAEQGNTDAINKLKEF